MSFERNSGREDENSDWDGGLSVQPPIQIKAEGEEGGVIKGSRKRDRPGDVNREGEETKKSKVRDEMEGGKYEDNNWGSEDEYEDQGEGEGEGEDEGTQRKQKKSTTEAKEGLKKSELFKICFDYLNGSSFLRKTTLQIKIKGVPRGRGNGQPMHKV